ncbi:hypothetical protein [Streptomyces althioticus]|uniref:hypothetical protein n=1 Tax=Streptomyces althioticus TaxID=83380 RepID=UPI00068B4EC7|nr:hypothetical protein [Actinospica acidiphila]WTC22013.1 hypothetical protein OG872_04790 [Streptomyces althioticus]
MTPQNQPQRAADIRPLRKRKRLWAAGAALFALGAIGGTQSAQDEVDAAQALAAKPVPAVTTTATTTATATVTAEPEPAPTVTKTKKVTTPGPTVTVTKTARAAAGSGTGNSAGSSDSGSGTCSIVSNAGNCYQAGQYCRNSDHGATTTTAGGARITCRYSSNAWRWSYS